MLPTTLLRTARVLLPSMRPTSTITAAGLTSSIARTFTSLSRRPTTFVCSRVAVDVAKEQTRGMVVRSSVKKMCPGCKAVLRKGGKTGKGHVYIICSLNPKHKQRQGK